MICFSVLILLLAGCTAPTCYPPNKIIGSKCCVDDNDNGVCDYDEEVVEEVPEDTEEVQDEPEEGLESVTGQMVAVEEEPPVQEEESPEPTGSGLEPGKYKIQLGEHKQYLQLNEMDAYRTSRDRGMMDSMTFTVRNIGGKKLNPVVELLFEGARVEEHSARVKKEYFLETINPGEKLVVYQSLGIRFEGLEEPKTLRLTVYERYASPREDLQIIDKEIIPTDYMDNMKIYTYGRPEFE